MSQRNELFIRQMHVNNSEKPVAHFETVIYCDKCIFDLLKKRKGGITHHLQEFFFNRMFY